MNKFYHTLHTPLVWLVILLFIVFYPMLISIYVFLPLLIGVMGYILILGIDKKKTHYILLSTIYFINLEVNLSLPFFLTLISSMFIYLLSYSTLSYLNKCKICRPLLSVLLIDAFYLGSILSYDFIFQTSSIVLDNILLYSLIVDLLVVVIL